MSVQKCVLSSTGRFIRVLENNEGDAGLYLITADPPKISENQVAFWENGKWTIKRKSKLDELEEYKAKLESLKNSVNMDQIASEISDAYKKAPDFAKRSDLPKRVIVGQLEIERSLLTKKMIHLFENNKRVTKKLKIYKKELDQKIAELNADRKGIMNDIKVDEKGNIIIDELVPSKVPF